MNVANYFQSRVRTFVLHCFGPDIADDKIERNHRFLEEALELVQAAGCTKSEAHQLVEYVFDRPEGDLKQEIGGVMVTLAALCSSHNVRMDALGEVELSRVWTMVDRIRAKQAAKPKHSPLPQRGVEPRRWRHVKRGSQYTEICRGELQAATQQPEEGELMVVYRGEEGNVWIRAAGEFMDGRFEEITGG